MTRFVFRAHPRVRNGNPGLCFGFRFPFLILRGGQCDCSRVRTTMSIFLQVLSVVFLFSRASVVLLGRTIHRRVSVFQRETRGPSSYCVVSILLGHQGHRQGVFPTRFTRSSIRQFRAYLSKLSQVTIVFRQGLLIWRFGLHFCFRGYTFMVYRRHVRQFYVFLCRIWGFVERRAIASGTFRHLLRLHVCCFAWFIRVCFLFFSYGFLCGWL